MKIKKMQKVTKLENAKTEKVIKSKSEKVTKIVKKGGVPQKPQNVT